EYHGLVLELGLAAVAEADAAGVPVPVSVRRVLLRMTDALAAIVDNRLRPPRQGDADDGYGLVLDGAGTHRWASLLATGDAVFGRLPWWPEVTTTDVRTPLLTALIHPGTDPASSARPPAPETRPVPLRPVPATPPSRRRLRTTADTRPDPAPTPDDPFGPAPDAGREPVAPPARRSRTADASPGPTSAPDGRLRPVPVAGA